MNILVATDITVYYRPDEEVPILVFKEIFKIRPEIKISLITSYMVPEGQCIIVRNDMKEVICPEQMK